MTHDRYDLERAETADVVRIARSVAVHAAERATIHDCEGAFPCEDIAQLHLSGLLRAPFPVDMGGRGLGQGAEGSSELRDVLVALGRGSLSLGRLYEGHVNAVILVDRYGTRANLALLLDEACVGRPSGVWMAESGTPLRIENNGSKSTLAGFKILASGCGYVRRPLVAARNDGGDSIMVIPFVEDGTRTDASGWTARGMQATATGTVDFSGIPVTADEIVGQPGDYLRSPVFRGGAWRVLAVQLGGLDAIMNLYRLELRKSPYAESQIQLGRFGEASIALETARLWVHKACEAAESTIMVPDAVDAYVDLARNAFEAAAQSVIALAQKAVGLKAFLRPHPLERVVRDLETYLRQPALDLSLMSAAAFYLHHPSDDVVRH